MLLSEVKHLQDLVREVLEDRIHAAFSPRPLFENTDERVFDVVEAKWGLTEEPVADRAGD